MNHHAATIPFPRLAVLLGLVLIAPVLGAAATPPAAPENAAPDSIGATDAPTPVAIPDTPSQTASWPDRERLARENRWPAGASDGAWVWRYMLSLVVVGGLMLGAFLALRRMRGMLGGNIAASQLRILGRVGLDKQNSVFLLRTNDEVLTIASGPQGVRVLARNAAGQPTGEDSPATPSNFGQVLHDHVRGERSE